MNKVAIVILNWNGKKFLEEFLPSVLKNSPGAKTIVADNSSTDDSVSYLKANYPEIEIIQIPENKGYTGGYNFALSKIKAEYFILLNSDIEVTPGWIDPIIKLMDSNESVVACQPKIKSYTEKDSFEYAGAAGGFIDKWGYPFCRGRIFENTEKDDGQYDNTCEIFWATGACLFIKAQKFHEVGGFDEYFFAHMEEIDLCWRLQSCGYKIYYCGESTIYHVGGGTLKKSNPHKTYLNFRNNIALLYKNLPSKKLYYVIFIRLILDGIAGIKFLFSNSPKHFFSVIKAHFSIYGSIGELRKKRATCRRTDSDKNIFPRSLVYEYFLSGKKKFKDLKF
jgi:GT2 family glycosyltransferase